MNIRAVMLEVCAATLKVFFKNHSFAQNPYGPRKDIVQLTITSRVV